MSLSRRAFLKVTVAATASCGAPALTDDASSDARRDGAPDGSSADAALPPRDGGADVDSALDAAEADAALDARPDGAPLDTGADADAGSLDARPSCEPDPDPDAGTGTAPDAGVDLASVPVSTTGFPLGVMAGDPLTTRAMIWTRYAGAERLVAHVHEVDGARVIRVVTERVVTPAAGGFVHLDVTGLRPGRRYRYAFLEQVGTRYTGRSRVGRFRTAPSDAACAPLVFGGASCNHRQGAPFGALNHAAAADLAFFVHCGDHIYADEGENAVTLAEYRAKYASYWPIQGLAAIHSATGLITTWDDHEVINNFDPEAMARTAAGRAQLDAARRAFFEHRAFRRNPTFPDRIWRSFRWGRTAEFFVLDVRGERRPSTRLTAGAQFISPEQLAWLQAGLRASTAVFKFVVTSKPITGRAAVDSERVDFWEGYPAQRNALLRFITDNAIPGVWFLSGDVHYGCIARVEASGPFGRLREVYMGPAGSGDPGVVRCTTSGQDDARVDALNYTRFRADPMARTLEIAFVGASGATLCSRTFPA